MVIAALAIGSNLGDRVANLVFARERLSALLANLRFSSTFETDPVDVIGEQSRFLNAAAVGETGLPARALLDELLAIEAGRGRERPFARAPRTLDLDVILFGDQIVNVPGLVVPHPRFRERLFVLEPLAEIAPELRDPVTGKTVSELLERLKK